MTLSLSLVVWFETIHANENSLFIDQIMQLHGGRKKKSQRQKSVKSIMHTITNIQNVCPSYEFIFLNQKKKKVMNLLSFGIRSMNKFSEKTRLWTSGIMWRSRNDDLLNQTQKATSHIQWSASFFGI